jgi:hypothetical protein
MDFSLLTSDARLSCPIALAESDLCFPNSLPSTVFSFPYAFPWFVFNESEHCFFTFVEVSFLFF